MACKEIDLLNTYYRWVELSKTTGGYVDRRQTAIARANQQAIRRGAQRNY